ncbi:MAG: hydroxyacylglutathione hydrolase [Proteobacteria bacterium]|nr:hydroxyacylglutathione hydrolase [Pseudomonadota bacterium]
MSDLHVLTVPAFHDNYLWLVHDTRHAVAIDPGDAAPILAALHQHGLSLTAIVLTHHHADHVGGVPKLLQHFNVPVYGPRHEHIDCISDPLDDDAVLTLSEPPLSLQVIATPGHTLGHLSYYAAEQAWLFCGDTLFAGGCGRLFEGTPQQMAASLAKLAALPDDTLVYCAHEYTLANLQFAQEVEPGNPALLTRINVEQHKRDQGLPTVPSSIGLEKATNPFLRYRVAEIIHHLHAAGRLQEGEPTKAFAALRTWKNDYRPS